MIQLFRDLERRSEVLQARVTPQERAFVEAEARRRGETISELTRAALGAFLAPVAQSAEGGTPCQPARS